MGMLLGIWQTILHGMRERFFFCVLLKWTRQFQLVEKPQNWLLVVDANCGSFFFLGDLKVAIGFLESKWYRIEVMEIHRNSHIAAFMLAEEVSIDFCKDLTLSHVHRGWWLR